MKSICLIVLYIGKLNEFFKLWLKTAEANETIDFYLFVDDEDFTKSYKPAPNISVIKTTLSDLKKRFEDLLGFEIALNAPYKLCDYRPTLGEAFREITQNYDFWGYCDCNDMLLGGVRDYLTDEVLEKYDRFFANGHLSIYKNTEKLNGIYKFNEGGYPTLNYKDVYKTDDSMYFDEQRGVYPKCLLNGIKFWPAKNVMRDPITCEDKFYFDGVGEDKQFIAFWENGQLFSVDSNLKKEKMLYCHFFRRKFEIESFDEVRSIKVVPGHVFINAPVTMDDFEYKEAAFYKARYYYRMVRNAVRRYGIRKNIQRRKWTKDSNKYLSELGKQQ